MFADNGGTALFSVAPGNFSTVILSNPVSVGNDVFGGTLDLSLAAGQQISLPLTFALTPSTATPEPSGVAIVLAGLLAIGGYVRYRYQKAV